jgi:ATP-binding cassette subfamily B protein
MKASRMNTTQQTIRLFWSHMRKYPKSVTALFIGIPFTTLINQFLPPLVMADVMNRLSTGDFKKDDLWGSFGGDLLLYAALVFTGGTILWRIVVMILWRLEGNVTRDVARRIFDHLLQQSASFHANNFGGSLVSQATKLNSAYIRLADTLWFQVLPLISAFIFATIILWPKAPLFVVILIGFSIVYMIVATLTTKNVRELNAREASASSKQTGFLADSITNVMAIKSFSSSTFESERYGEKADITFNRMIDVMHAATKRDVLFSSISTSISALALTMAAAGVVLFDANIATVFLILTYTANIAQRLWDFSGSTLRNYNRSMGDAKDMVEILNMTPEIIDNPTPEKVKISEGSIHFNNVVFTHDGSDGALFQTLNLRIKSGEKIGLVGHSGSGKTTLTRLLLRFSDIDSGEILIDGQNIANITQDDLRANIAYVPQEPLLFHRSIKENIAYGKPNATDEEIFEAARKANASEFIESLQDGYKTLVGERGVKLSGGQRQRIVIARAILKDAPILVLDEATSALDSESEILIQSALQKLMEKRTAIVIAHRLSTIQKMDRILVLEKGAIVEDGSHEKLVKQKGVYAQLWAHQSGGFIDS